jgi:hypothetical protein
MFSNFNKPRVSRAEKPANAHTDKLKALKSAALAGLTLASMSAMDMGESAQASELNPTESKTFVHDRHHPVLPSDEVNTKNVADFKSMAPTPLVRPVRPMSVTPTDEPRLAPNTKTTKSFVYDIKHPPVPTDHESSGPTPLVR